MPASLGVISGQTLLITARHAGQWLTVDDTVYIAPADGAEIRATGTGEVVVGPGWWDNLLIADGEYGGQFFDGNTTSHAPATANRIERSVDGGATWVELVDGLGPDATWTDPLPPFQGAVLYRVAAISDLGAETLSDPIAVDTTHGEIWIVGEDGTTLVLGLTLSIDPEWGHERVSEQYLGDRYPTAHYGQARPVTVQVSAAQLDGHGIDSEPWLLLGQDVYYRDPEGRAMWASITSGPTLPQTVRGVRQISLSLEAVEHAT